MGQRGQVRLGSLPEGHGEEGGRKNRTLPNAAEGPIQNLLGHDGTEKRKGKT